MASNPETTRPDIVARLRAVDHMSVEDCFLQSHLFAVAADEIERLRAAMRQVADKLHAMPETCSRTIPIEGMEWTLRNALGEEMP